MQIKFGADSFYIEGEDFSDFLSIKLTKKDRQDISAYIYTYGQPMGLYGIHLEFPWFNENSYDESTLVKEGVTLDQAISMLAVHFDIEHFEMNNFRMTMK